MTEPRPSLSINRRTLLRSIGGLGLVAGVVTGLDTTFREDSDAQFTGTQGDVTTPIEPLGSGTKPVSEFYDYRSDPNSPGNLQSNTGLEEPGTSRMFLYRGLEGLSLVIIHGGGNDPGGAASYELSGLPATGEWTILDDGNGTRDEFSIGDRIARLHWAWGADGRNDGAVFHGLGNAFEIQIATAFNDNAKLKPLGFGSIHDWQLLTGDIGDYETRELVPDEPITIRGNACGADTNTLSDETIDPDGGLDLQLSFSCNAVTVNGPEFDTVSLTFVDGVNERFVGPFTGPRTFSSPGPYTARENEIVKSIEVRADEREATVANPNVEACLKGAAPCDSPYDF